MGKQGENSAPGFSHTMPFVTLVPLALFCLVATITPGPNNMMLLSSGATFGLRRTIPHILGISLGGAVTSSLYFLWLAWRIATSADMHEARAAKRPFNMFDSAGFQWVNPKAWASLWERFRVSLALPILLSTCL